MDSKVIVTADEHGNVIVVSENNPLYGYIRVSQQRMEIDEDSGFAKRINLSALIPGKVETLEAFGWNAGDEIKGKIRIVEQKKPFSNKNPEKDYKVAGSSEIVCTVDDKPIYRKHFYSMNENAEDVFCKHTNKAAIQAFYANQKSAIKPNAEDFDV